MTDTLESPAPQEHLAAELPSRLLPHAVELYKNMRLSPDLRELTDDELAVYVCSEHFRSILGHYAEARRNRPRKL